MPSSSQPRTATPPSVPGQGDTAPEAARANTANTAGADGGASTNTPAPAPAPTATPDPVVDPASPAFQAAVAAAVQAQIAAMPLPSARPPAVIDASATDYASPESGPARLTDRGWVVSRSGMRLTPPTGV